MTATKATNVEKVGVLLVHGIGEQSQFEHLEAEVRNIVTALQKSTGETQTIQVVINSFPSAAFGAKQETWQDGGRAPVMVEVYDHEKVTEIYFHQVWWADLDEPTTLWTDIRFWLWGLSLWTIDGKFHSDLPGYGKRMERPKNVRGQKNIGFLGRLRLFWVALAIVLILPVLSLLNFVLRQLLAFKIPRPDILSQFLGDIKLLQQARRFGKGPLQDLGLPPRVTLRRRTIRGLVEMALRPYDRWYILAHSQGTVLAFNGIMETAQSLPNYLTKDLWRRCKAKSLITKAHSSESLTNEEKRNMLPFFPSWRDKEYILDRRRLFDKLRGLLTYGSPLSKFAALWPAIVPLNKDDSDVFHKDFQWLNVYDPTDPVAGETQPFQSDRSPSQFTDREGISYKAAEPIDIAYKANRFHLLSHVEYLNFSKGNYPPLVDIVANWLLTGKLTVNEDNLTVNSLTVKQGTPGWPNSFWTRVYQVARVTIWVFAALLIGGLLSVLISAVPQLSSYFQPISSFARSVTLPWLKWSIATVYLLGAFSTVGSLIGGTRFLWVGFVLAALITAVIAVLPLIVAIFPSIPQEKILSIQDKFLSIIFTTFLEGVFYILLAVIAVLIIGIIVKLFVRDQRKL